MTGRVARCDMARRTVARLVFGIERCSILCDFDARIESRDKIAGVTSVLQSFRTFKRVVTCVAYTGDCI